MQSHVCERVIHTCASAKLMALVQNKRPEPEDHALLACLRGGHARVARRRHGSAAHRTDVEERVILAQGTRAATSGTARRRGQARSSWLAGRSACPFRACGSIFCNVPIKASAAFLLHPVGASRSATWSALVLLMPTISRFLALSRTIELSILCYSAWPSRSGLRLVADQPFDENGDKRNNQTAGPGADSAGEPAHEPLSFPPHCNQVWRALLGVHHPVSRGRIRTNHFGSRVKSNPQRRTAVEFS